MEVLAPREECVAEQYLGVRSVRDVELMISEESFSEVHD